MFGTVSTTSLQQAAEQHAEYTIQTVISCLSMFGCLVIILSYFLFEDLQTTSRRILVYISFGDFFTVFPTLILMSEKPKDLSSNPRDCVVQSFVTTTAVMWSFLWTSSLAIYLYLVVVKKRQELAEKLMVPFHIVSWGLPLILVGVAGGIRALGPTDAKYSGGWCWIKEKYHGVHWKSVLLMLACGKLLEIASYFVNAKCYFSITRKIKEEVRREHDALSSESIQAAVQGQRKLALAPVLFVFLRIWGTIRFIIFGFHPKLDMNTIASHFLLICHIIGDNSQGFVNFVLFCVFTARFRENIRRMCCKKKSTNQERDPLIARSGESIHAKHSYIFKDPGPITFYT